MKRLIAALAMISLAQPAAAAPAELVCTGTHHMYVADYPPYTIDGIHILIVERKIQISGTPFFSDTYSVDLNYTDTALIWFSSGTTGGHINRFSGELTLWKFGENNRSKMDHFINATCDKADPLF